MEKPDVLNIPAYQRKRSLAAKARKKKIAKPSRSVRRVRLQDPPEIFQFPLRVSSYPTSEPTPEPIIQKAPTTGIREMTVCGICEGYFDNINVAIIKVTSVLRQGDSIIFEKNGGLFEQPIDSMQINRQDVSMARSGSDIGMKVAFEPIVGSTVYKVI